MKSLRKNWKTSLVALMGCVSLVVCLAMLFMNKIEAQDFAVAMSSIGMFIGVMIGIFAKDGDKTGV